MTAFDPALARLATDAAQTAAAALREQFSDDAEVESANGRDIKTRADRVCETLIVDRLAPTNIAILAEESGGTMRVADDELHWIVDPLDGTMNFVRHLPLACISVALWRGRRPLLGVIVDIARDELYLGIVGRGATCNGQAITCGTERALDQAVLASGLPVGRSFATPDIDAFVQRLRRFKKIRMIGSAALSLAWVARGWFDAYHEQDIRIWDVAAGMALVQAAGGACTTSAIAADGKLTLFAANLELAAREHAA